MVFTAKWRVSGVSHLFHHLKQTRSSEARNEFRASRTHKDGQEIQLWFIHLRLCTLYWCSAGFRLAGALRPGVARRRILAIGYVLGVTIRNMFIPFMFCYEINARYVSPAQIGEERSMMPESKILQYVWSREAKFRQWCKPKTLFLAIPPSRLLFCIS